MEDNLRNSVLTQAFLFPEIPANKKNPMDFGSPKKNKKNSLQSSKINSTIIEVASDQASPFILDSNSTAQVQSLPSKAINCQF